MPAFTIMGEDKVNIAVLSGKGGTGKTFISVNLASVIGNSTYIDCDVEEPNGHLFFKPENVISEDVYLSIPEIDYKKCDGCRKCVDFCKFNALAFIKERPVKFKNVCHACGGCKIVCSQDGICQGVSLQKLQIVQRKWIAANMDYLLIFIHKRREQQKS